MGTFHENLGDLHGITVVVETDRGTTIIGRCHTETEDKIILHDADVHQDGENNLSSDQYMTNAVKWGVFKKHDHLVLEKTDIGFTKVTPLNQL